MVRFAHHYGLPPYVGKLYSPKPTLAHSRSLTDPDKRTAQAPTSFFELIDKRSKINLQHLSLPNVRICLARQASRFRRGFAS